MISNDERGPAPNSSMDIPGLGLPSQQYIDMSGLKELPVDELEAALESAPPELREMIETHELYKKKFTYHLRKLTEDGPLDGAAFLESKANLAPTYNYIGVKYGPGKYLVRLMWRRAVTEDRENMSAGKMKSMDTEVLIDDSFTEAHEEYLLKAQIDSMNRKKQMVEKQKLKHQFDVSLADTAPAEGIETSEDKIEQMKKMMEIMNLQKRPETDWAKILAAIAVVAAPIVTALVNRQPVAPVAHNESFEKMMMLMFANEKSNSQQLLELVKGGARGTDPMDSMQKLISTLGGVVDLKEALHPSQDKEEGVIDKILSMVDKSLPVILALSAMPKGAPQRVAGEAMVRAIPEVGEVLADPAKVVATVDALDAQYGVAETDQLLEGLGIARPPQCVGKVEEATVVEAPHPSEQKVT